MTNKSHPLGRRGLVITKIEATLSYLICISIYDFVSHDGYLLDFVKLCFVVSFWKLNPTETWGSCALRFPALFKVASNSSQY